MAVASWLAATGLAVGLEAVAATPIPVVSAVPYLADSGSVAVQCGRLIDGVAARTQGPATVVIRSGRVDSVQPGAVAPAGMTVVDLKQYTCLPGLIDMHTHLTDSGHETADLSVYYKRTQAEQGAIARESARATLLAGLALLLFAVFPANVNQAVNRVEIPGLPTPPRAALWARLPFQALMIWAVLAGTQPAAPPVSATD